MFLGIEIGGTKLQLGLGEGNGKLAGLWRDRIEPANGPEGIRQQIMEAVPFLLDDVGMQPSNLEAVGIGFGGPVDDARHTVIKSHQIAGWDDFPLAKWIGDFLQLPAYLANDSDVAGLAEASTGAGRGLSPIYYMNIGSGIGGGFIVDGRVYRGTGKGAAETGHLRIAVPAESGLRYHTLEDLASGWGIERRARALLAKSGHLEDGIWPEDAATSVNVEQIGMAARAGSALAREILDPAIDALAEALCHVIALLCPRRIVVGGGVALLGEETLFKPLSARVQSRVFVPFGTCYKLVSAALGEEVVVHGALIWASQSLAKDPARQ
ncbi:ROK family glucokinase [soil metagenome]